VINSAYAVFLALDKQDRRDLFDARAEELGTLGQYVEKDFWVALVLDTLFNGELAGDHPRPLFRGGTSLSRVFGLIERFSEDIDITFHRSHGIFESISDPEEEGISKNETRRRLDALSDAVGSYMSEPLREGLATVLSAFGRTADTGDDTQTLMVTYPSVFTASDIYVAPSVKIEGGARCAVEPSQVCGLAPYVNATWHGGDLNVGGITTIAAERTFWDKIYILHSWYCGYRDETRVPTDRHRLSRHYYDVARIAQSPVADAALADAELREDARQRREVYFPSGWAKIGEAVPGTLRLVPCDKLRVAVERDYEAMSGMIHGDGLPFEEVIEVLSTLEARINTLK